MEKSIYFKPIAIFASLSALIQSVAWFILTLIALLAYSCLINIPPQSSATDLFRFYLLQLYFQEWQCTPTTEIATPEDLWGFVNTTPEYINKWMVSYLVLSVVHFFLSLLMFIYVGKPKKERFTMFIIAFWCIIGFGFACMDAWLSAEITQDLVVLGLRLEAAKLPNLSWVTGVPVMLMIVSARGYIIWLLNLILLIYFGGYALDFNSYKAKRAKVEKANHPPINGFDNPDAKSIKNSEALDAFDLYRRNSPPARQDVILQPPVGDRQSDDNISWPDFDNFEEQPPPQPVVVAIPPPMRPKTPPVHHQPKQMSSFVTPVPIPVPDRQEDSESSPELERRNPDLMYNMFAAETIINAKKSLRKVDDRKRTDVRPPPNNFDHRLRHRVLPTEPPINRRSEDTGFNSKLFEQGHKDDTPAPAFPLFSPVRKPPEKKNFGKPILAPSSPIIKRKVLAEDNNYY